MTPEKQEQAVKWLTEEIRSLRMAPAINGCGPENWADLLEIMETCLEAVRDYHFPDTREMVPLTLEQLRGKVGQPVVIKYSYGGPHTFAIVDVRYVPHLGADKIRLVFPDGYITVNEKDYGTYFTTYAYPPAHIDREQVERMRGEWVAKHRHRGGFRRVTGVDDMGEQRTITIDDRCEYDDRYCSKCGKQSPDNFLNFCGYCGAPMTDKAVQMVMERLEKLYEAN